MIEKRKREQWKGRYVSETPSGDENKEDCPWQLESLEKKYKWRKQ